MNPETRRYVIMRDVQTCQHCGRPLSYENCEIAHRIANTKTALKYVQRYAREHHNIELDKTQAQSILDDEYNLRTACRGGRCNDAMNCFNQPLETDSIIRKILFKRISEGCL